MAGTDFGGVMRVRTAAGEQLSIRGNFMLSPSAISVAAEAAQDGTVDRIITPKPQRADLTIVDRAIDSQALLSAPRQPITIVEDTTGVQHLFSDAFFDGDPQINRLTGEVTGLGIVGLYLRRVG